ncbi:MAG: hypothetical protein DI551_11380 [Micavibrio aeruginosavorus]|uniref:EF-hand domain-containing protein n=1 Tax=Micavibrio aeruginosavorus TaxID=349221 RepID=A0A2W5MSS7_9BACT|nr:MAG: hypothetical protein DI551_11380 [Micavibrio aeruginosavorus]
MHTVKKFAFLGLLSMLVPLASHEARAANNEDAYKPAHKIVVSKAETQKPADFSTTDADHSGAISMKEFMAHSGLKESPKKIHESFAALDKNHDRKLTPEEFSGSVVR